jgi:uncharacterized membrane protein
MPTLTVWRYPTALGAQVGEIRLKALQQRGKLTVDEAMTVTWVPGTRRPHLSHLRDRSELLAGRSLLGGLLDLALRRSVYDREARIAVSHTFRRLRRAGVDPALLTFFRAELTAGTSALLVLSETPDIETIASGVAWGESALLHTELSADAVQALRDLVAALGRPESHTRRRPHGTASTAT